MLELEEILKAELKSTCNDMEIYKEECYCYILCNYEKENSHIFRKSVRYAIDQINAKRFRLWDARYSVAMGIDVDNTEKLYDSLDSCRRAMDNRLLEGGERLLDPPAVNNQFDCRELTEPYCRIFDKASDLCDEKIIAEGVEKFGTNILKVKNITGEDLLKAVMMIGTHAVNTLQSEEAHDQLILFRKKCGHCSSADQLFGVLENTLVQILQKKKQQFEEEERKPIRIAKQYMQNHYMEPITLELVADKVGFNSSYFSSFFKKETGAGFADYLIQLRMEKAKELGAGVLCIEGNLDFYGKSGFVLAGTRGIRYHGEPEQELVPYFLLRELRPGFLDGVTGVYHTPQGYYVDEAAAEVFDRSFPPKEKLKLPGQLF